MILDSRTNSGHNWIVTKETLNPIMTEVKKNLKELLNGE